MSPKEYKQAMHWCQLCGQKGTDTHHIKAKGMGRYNRLWDSECNYLLLCRKHHQFIHSKGINETIKVYPHLEKILKSKGWEKVEQFNKWICPRLTNEEAP